MKKVYYQLVFHQQSPLRIGNGRHEQSDTDLMLDGRGLPFIPGTSLAGIIRHETENRFPSKTKALARLFGYVKEPESENEEAVSVSSALLVGDAVLPAETSAADIQISNRDGVGLNDWGTAISGAKYDFQISETELPYTAIMEWSGDDSQYQTEILGMMDPVMKNYAAAGIRAGARTTRGFGNFEVSVKKKEFTFPDDVNQWLDFSPYSKEAFRDVAELTGVNAGRETILQVGFAMQSAFSVRVNTARTEILEDGTVPDSVPLENDRGNPVIPGTAWAGAFRHHMLQLLRDLGIQEYEYASGGEKKVRNSAFQEVDLIFGKGETPETGQKSQIAFSEAEIVIADKSLQQMSIMRTAIDRFTASPKNSALFTSRVYFGGEGSLEITLSGKISRRFKALLAACICDIQLGLLTVGGEAAVGRGLMKVTSLKINGRDCLGQMLASIDAGAPMNWLEGTV